MKNYIVAVAAASLLASCSAVSSVIQNTFPYTSNFVVTQGSPSGTQLSAVGAGTSLSQITGISANVKDILPATATLTITSGAQGMGIFRSVNVYITSGGQEVLVASRDNISDNIGNTLSLDVNGGRALDDVLKSGQTLQQRIVYVFKSSPSSDLNIKSSISFNSVPVK